MNKFVKVLLITALLLPFSASAQQGSCKVVFERFPTLKDYMIKHQAKCWSSTMGDDVIKVIGNRVNINGVNQGVYGPDLNLFYGFDGNDIIYSGDKTDWIYGGSGNDTIYVSNLTAAFGEEGQNTYVVTKTDKKFIGSHLFDYDPSKDTIQTPKPVISTDLPPHTVAKKGPTLTSDDICINKPKTIDCPCEKENILTGALESGTWQPDLIEDYENDRDVLMCDTLFKS